jgi:hypothetical protein
MLDTLLVLLRSRSAWNGAIKPPIPLTMQRDNIIIVVVVVVIVISD